MMNPTRATWRFPKSWGYPQLSSILIGCSLKMSMKIINHPGIGVAPTLMETPYLSHLGIIKFLDDDRNFYHGAGGAARAQPISHGDRVTATITTQQPLRKRGRRDGVALLTCRQYKLSLYCCERKAAMGSSWKIKATCCHYGASLSGSILLEASKVLLLKNIAIE